MLRYKDVWGWNIEAIKIDIRYISWQPAQDVCLPGERQSWGPAYSRRVIHRAWLMYRTIWHLVSAQQNILMKSSLTNSRGAELRLDFGLRLPGSWESNRAIERYGSIAFPALLYVVYVVTCPDKAISIIVETNISDFILLTPTPAQWAATSESRTSPLRQQVQNVQSITFPLWQCIEKNVSV